MTVSPREQMRVFAKGFPEAHEDFPWGESAIKVRGKVFVFMRRNDEGVGLSVKLPVSRYFALDYPFTKQTGYGLGKSGWVTASFGVDDEVPLDVLQAWVDESYRAVAPKKLVAGTGEWGEWLRSGVITGPSWSKLVVCVVRQMLLITRGVPSSARLATIPVRRASLTLGFNIGSCLICNKRADIGVGGRACESCQQDFEKLCEACATRPCPKCGSILCKIDDIFPNSLFAAIKRYSTFDVERLLDGRSVNLDNLFERNGSFHPLARAALLDTQ